MKHPTLAFIRHEVHIRKIKAASEDEGIGGETHVKYI